MGETEGKGASPLSPQGPDGCTGSNGRARGGWWARSPRQNNRTRTVNIHGHLQNAKFPNTCSQDLLPCVSVTRTPCGYLVPPCAAPTREPCADNALRNLVPPCANLVPRQSCGTLCRALLRNLVPHAKARTNYRTRTHKWRTAMV